MSFQFTVIASNNFPHLVTIREQRDFMKKKMLKSAIFNFDHAASASSLLSTAKQPIHKNLENTWTMQLHYDVHFDQ